MSGIKIIHTNEIEGISLIDGSENAAYPLLMLVDANADYPGRTFRSSGTSCTIRIADTGNARAIALIRMDGGENIFIELSDGGGVARTHDVQLSAVDGKSYVEIGVLKCGACLATRSMLLDAEAGRKDAGVSWEMNSAGSGGYKPGQKCFAGTGQIIFPVDEEVDSVSLSKFMENTWDKYGKMPLIWNGDFGEGNKTLFLYMNDTPSIKRYGQEKKVSISLHEKI